MRLRNGTVLPHGLLGDGASRGASAFNRSYKNTTLRAGIIVRRYETSDKNNVSKLAPEYDVNVVEQDENLGMNCILYRNCLSVDGLGSIADFFEKKLRTQGKYDKLNAGKDFKGQDGAVVIMLCIDGVGSKGVILGGLHHPDRSSKLTGKEAQLKGEYNGINISVNEDGSTNLTFRGATDNQGKVKDKSQGNTTIDIEKDGSFQVKHKGVTQRAEKDGKYILTTEDSTSVTAKKEISLKTEDKFLLKATSDAEMEMEKLLIKASGSATMTAQSLEIQTEGNTSVKAQMVEVEGSSMVIVRAPSMILEGQVSLGSAGGTPAVTMQTQYIGMGNLGAPVLSTAIGPFSTKVRIT